METEMLDWRKEFEFDPDSAQRIADVIEENPMSLQHCAEILEAVAPLCTCLKARGFLRRMEAHNVIRSMPTIDAVPIVRCKDCKFRDGTPGQPNILCGQMKETDFCSYGEKAK